MIIRSLKEERKAKKIKRTAIAVGLTAITTLMASGIKSVKATAEQYQNSNKIFNVEKVDKDLEYWGGDNRYVDKNFNLFLGEENKIYNHFAINEDRPIKIGYSSNITKIEEEQFNHAVNHINYIFSVVNDNYKFETTRVNNISECDIFVDSGIVIDYDTTDNKKTAAYVKKRYEDKINTSNTEKAIIKFNKDIKRSTADMRYQFLHEMCHVLWCSPDVDDTMSSTISVYNYCDVEYITSNIGFAWESVEDYNNQTIKALDNATYNVPSLIYTDENLNGGAIPYLPLMTREEKNSFVSYLPTDVSTFIALYGDSSTKENKIKYLNLLNEILVQNKKILDIDYSIYNDPIHANSKPKEQPYYKDDFKLPTLEEIEKQGRKQVITTNHDEDEMTF